MRGYDIDVRAEDQARIHSFKNMKDPIGSYLHSEPLPKKTIIIPYNEYGDVVFYSEVWRDEQTFYKADRRANEYRVDLFSDEFETVENDLRKGPHTVRRLGEKSRLIAGGIENAFAPGKTVLDLGSGRAYAILQFSRDYPMTNFIGVDARYDQVSPVDIKEPGVHLIDDYWSDLRTIPDCSVDTIISERSLFTWGIGSNEEPETNKQIIDSINRVTKPGAIMRYDTERGSASGEDEGGDEKRWIVNFLNANGWDVFEDKGKTNVAIKRNQSIPMSVTEKNT